jgi:hypothetical protein
VVRLAKSKSTILPEEPGYGTESVRDEIYRIVDILDPIDRVKIRYVLPSNPIVLSLSLGTCQSAAKSCKMLSPVLHTQTQTHRETRKDTHTDTDILTHTGTHAHTHTHTPTHPPTRTHARTHGCARVARTNTTSLTFCERTLIYLSP